MGLRFDTDRILFERNLFNPTGAPEVRIPAKWKREAEELAPLDFRKGVLNEKGSKSQTLGSQPAGRGPCFHSHLKQNEGSFVELPPLFPNPIYPTSRNSRHGGFSGAAHATNTTTEHADWSLNLSKHTDRRLGLGPQKSEEVPDTDQDLRSRSATRGSLKLLDLCKIADKILS